MDPGALLYEAWLILLLSILLSAVAFPFVVCLSFLYKLLRKRYPKTPGVLLFAVLTFAGTLAFLVLLELYLGITVGQAAALLK